MCVSSRGLTAGGPNERPSPGFVIVGFDGSPASTVAIGWATREAAARGLILRISSGTTSKGDLRRALVEVAEQADLLVLSTSNDESAETVLLSSLARKALRRSPCPVVIIRGTRTERVRNIVIGVDGSGASNSALDWACIEASMHGADLVVVHSPQGDVSRAEAECVVKLAINECRERTDVDVRGVLAEGSPELALIDASRDADIVAIGSRGRGGFKTVVFGSVALAVAEGADCPVAVIHPTPRLD